MEKRARLSVEAFRWHLGRDVRVRWSRVEMIQAVGVGGAPRALTTAVDRAAGRDGGKGGRVVIVSIVLTVGVDRGSGAASLLGFKLRLAMAARLIVPVVGDTVVGVESGRLSRGSARSRMAGVGVFCGIRSVGRVKS